MLNLIIVAWAAALAGDATPSGCGWFGFELAAPAVEVRGADVRLASPLQILRVADGSPAAAAGLRGGMEIQAIDGERWDAPGFLPNVVRLQTAAADDKPRFTVSRDGVESEVRVRAAACSGAQLEERARLLATLGRMEGASWDRYRARRSQQAAESDAPDHPDELLAAGELAELDEEDLAGLEDAMEDAARAMREAQAQMSSPEIRRRIEESLRTAERDLASPELQRRIEQSLREAQRSLSQPQALARLDEALRQSREGLEAQALAQREIEAALERTSAQLDDTKVRMEIDSAMRDAHRRLGEATAQHQLAEEMRRAAEAEAHSTAAQAGSEARRQIEAAMRDAQRQLESSGWRGDLEESLRSLEADLAGLDSAGLGAEALAEARLGMGQALAEMERAREAASDARQFEVARIQDEVRQALAEANEGREERRRALLEASRATRHVEVTGRLLAGADLVAAEDAEEGDEGEDHEEVGDGAPGERGLHVRHLDAGSALARAGVQEGDRIVRAGGMLVFEVGDLFEAILHRLDDDEEPGSLTLEVEGASGRRTLRLSLAAQ